MDTDDYPEDMPCPGCEDEDNAPHLCGLESSLGGYQECINSGAHAQSVDEDGYCNTCGEH